jgi:hypothetical protein
MRLARGFRERTQGALEPVSQELDHLTAQINGGWKVQHTPDGTHKDVTADSLDVAGETSFGGPWWIPAAAELSAPLLTADVNDWNPRGLDTAITVRLRSDASRNITGLATTDTRRGRWILLFNGGSFDVVLKHNDPASRETYRISCPNGTDLTLQSGDSVWVMYDKLAHVWRAVGV